MRWRRLTQNVLIPLMQVERFPPACSGATLICIPRSRWTQGAFGNRLGLEEAYRFARGEEVESTTAGRTRLARPLDFLVVADHSDNMGFFPDLNAASPAILADPKGKEWYDKVQAGEGMAVAMAIIDSFSRGTFPEKLMYWPDVKDVPVRLGQDD